MVINPFPKLLKILLEDETFKKGLLKYLERIIKQGYLDADNINENLDVSEVFGAEKTAQTHALTGFEPFCKTSYNCAYGRKVSVKNTVPESKPMFTRLCVVSSKTPNAH